MGNTSREWGGRLLLGGKRVSPKTKKKDGPRGEGLLKTAKNKRRGRTGGRVQKKI